MKRLLLNCLLLLGGLSAAAQDVPSHGVFNLLGLQANVGTLGLGFGRLVPKRRVGCRVEPDVQLHGKMQMWQDGRVAETADSEGGDDDISKIVESVRVYPVLRLCLTGCLF